MPSSFVHARRELKEETYFLGVQEVRYIEREYTLRLEVWKGMLSSLLLKGRGLVPWVQPK